MAVSSEFFKMTAAGNDFILFDNRAGTVAPADRTDWVRRLCTRGLSVGADGVILLEDSSRADLRARFFNPDGGSTFCGNGGRCVARLAYLNGIAPARMKVESDLGVHRAEVRGADVSFEMPDLKGFEEQVEVEVLGRVWTGSLVDTGVPHFVTLTGEPAAESINEPGRALRSHPRFGSGGANVNFVWSEAGGEHDIRTYERGVEGETLACATGCVAAAIVLAAAGRARSPVRLRTRSGAVLQVRYESDPRNATGIRVEGEARLVYVGHLADEALTGFVPRH